MTTDSLTTEPQPLSARAESVALKPKRYHPVLVALHWLVAILMFSAVFLRPEEGERFRPGGEGFEGSGEFQPGNFPPPGNFTPQTQPIDIHMVVGVIILVLMLVRLVVRFTTRQPEWATTGNRWLDRLGGLTHFGLYVLIFLILGAGGIMAYQDGLLAGVLGSATTSTQGFSFGGFLFRALHGLSWNLLLLLLVLHIGASLYHQFIRKDNLLGRMWFGR
jgi:cytochrome b561